MNFVGEKKIHRFLEASGAAITACRFTGSKDALDERMLPAVPIFAGQTGVHSISPLIQSSSIQVRTADPYKLDALLTLVRHILGEGAIFQSIQFISGISSIQKLIHRRPRGTIMGPCAPKHQNNMCGSCFETHYQSLEQLPCISVSRFALYISDIFRAVKKKIILSQCHCWLC